MEKTKLVILVIALAIAVTTVMQAAHEERDVRQSKLKTEMQDVNLARASYPEN